MSQRKASQLRKGLFHSPGFALAFALILGALVAACFAAREAEPDRRLTETAPSASPAANPIIYRFVAGERLVYRLDYASSSGYDLQSLFGNQPPAKQPATPSSLAQSFETSAQGELTATVIGWQGGHVLIAYSLRQPKVSLTANGQEATAQAEAVSGALSRNLFAQVNAQGRVIAVLIEPGASNLAQTFARALLAATQFALPDEPAAGLQNWEAQEDDPNGQFVARYEAEAGDTQTGLRTFRKTRLRYLPPRRQGRPNQFDPQTTIKPSGHLTARFDFGNSRLVSLNGSEAQTILIANKTVARANTTLSLNFVRSETTPSTELAALRRENEAREKQTAALPLSATSEEAGERAIHAAELGEATLESLLASLAKAESAPDHHNDRLYLKFKALIYLHPESSVEIGKILAKAGAESFTMRTLTAALGAVGHAQAQSALVNAMRARPQDNAALRLFIPALGEASKPTPLAEAALRDLAFSSSDREAASMAQLALGAMAQTLATTAPERAQSLVERFLKELASASSEPAIRQWLLVLGNAGAEQSLPAIARFTDHSAPGVRAAAASSLRWIEDPRADELLAGALTADPEAAVRSEAAAALSSREMNTATFEAQKKAFQTDKAVNVRLTLLRNLWRAQGTFPEARRLVETAAAKDESKEVRKQAQATMR
jgi:hypothetical protein